MLRRKFFPPPSNEHEIPVSNDRSANLCTLQVWLLLITAIVSSQQTSVCCVIILLLIVTLTSRCWDRLSYSSSRRRVRRSRFPLQGSCPWCIMQIPDVKRNWQYGIKGWCGWKACGGLLHINNEGWAAALTCSCSNLGGDSFRGSMLVPSASFAQSLWFHEECQGLRYNMSLSPLGFWQKLMHCTVW